VAILVAFRRFPGMGVVDSRSLRSDICVRMKYFGRGTAYVPFRRFWGMCGESLCNVFLLLFMVLWVPISAKLCRRVVPMLWHAFLFLGLRFFPFFLFFAWWLMLLFLVRKFTDFDWV
jgi:hypothetical protein